jgi:effector-binding domain-containing protein
MSFNCEAHLQIATPTLSVRSHTPVQGLPDLLGNSYMRISQYLAELGETPAGYPFVAYYNMDLQDLDVEAGYAVSKPLAGRDDIQPGALPQGLVATCVYTGPYLGMGPAYEELTQWVKDNGHEASGVIYEFYRNDPAQVPPEELETQIVFLLEA